MLVLARETVLAACGFLGAYSALHSLWPEPKRRAWVITFLAAGLSVASSVRFVVDVVWALGDVRVLSELDEARAGASAAAVHVFQGYLVADLVAGALHYAGQINVLTGWCHHIVYILLLQYVLARGAPWTSIFTLALVMELPTFLLAAARLVPRARHDGLFNASFFATRICLHVALIVAYALPPNRPDGSWAPACLFALAFPLHAFWFARQIQLRREARRSAKATSHIVVPLKLSVQITSGSPAPMPAAAAAAAAAAATTRVQDGDDAALAALKSPPPEADDDSQCSSSSSSSSSSEDDLVFVPTTPPPSPEIDLHLLRHALKESAAAAEEPLRIRAMLIAASRGRYAALAARARGLYREAWARNRPPMAAYARSPTALRREVVVN